MEPMTLRRMRWDRAVHQSQAFDKLALGSRLTDLLADPLEDYPSSQISILGLLAALNFFRFKTLKAFRREYQKGYQNDIPRDTKKENQTNLKEC